MVGDDQSGAFALAMEDQLRRNDQDSLLSCRQFCLDGAFIKQGGAEPGFPLVNANFLWISFIFKLRKHPSRVRARIRIYIKKCATALCRSADENKSEIRVSQNFTFDMKRKTTKQRRFYPSAVLYVSTNTVPKNSLSGSYLCAVWNDSKSDTIPGYRFAIALSFYIGCIWVQNRCGWVQNWLGGC